MTNSQPNRDAHIWGKIWETSSEEGSYSFTPSRYERALDKVAYFIKSGVKFTKGEKILEAGCGDGLVLASLLALFDIDGHGIDFCDIARRQAMSTMAESGQPFKFTLSDVRQTPYPSDFFDKIICLGVVEHFDPLPAIEELHRILKPKGSLIIMTPNKLSVGKWERIIRQRLGKWEFGYQTEYTCSELSILLKSMGFTIVKTGVDLRQKTVNQRFHLKLITTADQIINSIWPQWGFYSYVFTTKSSSSKKQDD